jgi:hypothetical protein
MANWLDTITNTAAAPGTARKQTEAEVCAQYARNAAAALRADAALPEINLVGTGPVLRRGERAFFRGSAN